MSSSLFELNPLTVLFLFSEVPEKIYSSIETHYKSFHAASEGVALQHFTTRKYFEKHLVTRRRSFKIFTVNSVLLCIQTFDQRSKINIVITHVNLYRIEGHFKHYTHFANEKIETVLWLDCILNS